MTTQSRGRSSDSWRFALLSLALCLLVWGVFGRTVGYSFVNYDDGSYVYANAQVRAGLHLESVRWAFTHIHSQNWHPLTTISHMLDVQCFGINPGPQHLVNVGLHAVTVLLLFVALRQLSAATWKSAFAAALFAVHPLRVESVAWISERKDVLSGLFFVLTLWTYARYARGRAPRLNYALTIPFLALGLLSKPMLVSTPIVLLLLDYWPLRRLDRRNFFRRIVEKLPLVALAAASCVATILAQRAATGSVIQLPFLWRAENAIVSCVIYMRQMFWPVDLAVFYPHPEGTLPAIAVVAGAFFLMAITAVALVWRKRAPYLLTGWLWYLVMLLPVIGLVQVGLQGHADRYTYLPQIGLYVVVIWGVAELIPKRYTMALAGAGAIVVATLALVSARQVTYWKNSEALWTRALSVSPRNDVALGGLGGVLLDKGDVDNAIANFQAALQIRRENVEVRRTLGDALMRKGKVEEAISNWQYATGLEPEDTATLDKLGSAMAQSGKLNDAMARWRESLRIDPGDVNALNNLAWVMAAAPDPSLRDGTFAVRFAERAISLAGENNAIILRTLGAAYAEAGQFDDAVRATSRAAEVAQRQGNAALVEELRRFVQMYQTNMPLRDPGLRESAGGR